MSSLGIYFGPKTISIVETKGKKVINHAFIPQTTVSAGELEEKVPAEVKLIGIVALFKEELRKKKIDAKEATLCFSGKDLIIRTFEMPKLPREELQSAINFEAKKYIPFKVEDLISDFQLRFDKATRTNETVFVGIKKETLDSYVSLLRQLDIKIKSIEYSAFSVLRVLKAIGAGDRGVIGVLGLDLQSKDEVNFIVVEDGFPLFSRDIALASGPDEALTISQEAGTEGVLEKLKKEIRLSLDYYQRKFPTKTIKRIHLLSNHENSSELEAFMIDIGLAVKFIDISKYIDKAIPYSLDFVKGYSASLAKVVKTSLKVDLLAANQRARFIKEKAIGPTVSSLLEGLIIDSRVVILGALICAGAFGYGYYNFSQMRKTVDSTIALRQKIQGVSSNSTYDQLVKMKSGYEVKLTVLENLVKKQPYLTEPLRAIPMAMPQGVWLRNIDYTNVADKQNKSKIELNIEGNVYLPDTEKEFETVNAFVENLKGNSDFKKYFKNISIKSLDRKVVEESITLNFFISCKSD